MSHWQPKEPCVYILASKCNGVLYIGVTSTIYDRMMRHLTGADEGFTKRYGVHILVYCEFHATMENAIKRETQLKKWKRAWKVRLIQDINPEWTDLFDPDEGIKVAPADRERFYKPWPIL